MDSPNCPKSAVGQDGQVGQWITMDSPNCPKSAVGQDGQVGQWIPMDSPNCPTCMVQWGGPRWDCGFQWSVPPVLRVASFPGTQWDKIDRWDVVGPVVHCIWWALVGQWIPMVGPTCPTWYSDSGFLSLEKIFCKVSTAYLFQQSRLSKQGETGTSHLSSTARGTNPVQAGDGV